MLVSGGSGLGPLDEGDGVADGAKVLDLVVGDGDAELLLGVDDLDVDSLSMVEVVVAAEEKFGVSIPDDEVKNLRTVGDAVAFIERAQG